MADLQGPREPRDLADAERRIEERVHRIKRDWCEIGLLLRAVRDRRLYRDRGYTSFDAWCREQWQLERTNAHRIIQAAEDREAGVAIDNVGQSRALLEVPDAKTKRELVEAVRAEHGRVTAPLISEAWKRRKETEHFAGRIREVLLLFTPEEFERFEAAVNRIRRATGIERVKDVVLFAARQYELRSGS